MADYLHSSGESSLTGLTLLAVDDIDLNLMLLQDMLEYYGATVVGAHSGAAAVEQVAQQIGQFHLVLMDVNMPQMDGMAATQILHTFDPTLPVLAISANADKEAMLLYHQAGMSATLEKPFQEDLLVATILDHYRRTH